jgi:hypothetical protein
VRWAIERINPHGRAELLHLACLIIGLECGLPALAVSRELGILWRSLRL